MALNKEKGSQYYGLDSALLSDAVIEARLGKLVNIQVGALLKRFAAGQKVVDAFDVDWTGYKINGEAITSAGEVIEKIGEALTTSSSALSGIKLKYVAAVAAVEAQEAQGTEGEEGYVPAVEAKDAVPAHIDLVALDDEGKETTTSFGQILVSDIIGNGVLDSSSYAKETGILTLNFKNADGTTNAVSVNLAELLDINDIIIDEDSKKYLEVDLTGGENSQAKFSAKIQNISTASPAIDNTVYDAKIKNSENVATITYTGNTLSGTYEGNTIQFDEISIKTPLIVDGEIVSYNTSTSYINHNKTLSVGTTITSSDRYSEDEVEEMVAAYSQEGVLSAFMHEGGASYEITKINDNGIPAVTGLADAIDVKNYVDQAVAGANSAAEDAIKDLDADITSDDDDNVEVTVTQTDGKITGVSVSVEYATATGSATGLSVDNEDALLYGDAVNQIKTYIDGKTATVELGNAVGLTKATEGENAGKYVAADGTVGDGLATAGDVAAEIVADEKVIAAALNDHESRISTLEELTVLSDDDLDEVLIATGFKEAPADEPTE